MIAMSLVLALASGTALLTSGYFYGAKRGRMARAVLAEDAAQKDAQLAARERAMAASDQRIVELSGELSRHLAKRPDARDDDLRREIRTFMHTVSEQERGQEALRKELREGLAAIGKQNTDPQKFEKDIQKVLQPLLRKQEDTTALRDMMRDLLAPMIERDRIGKELSRLEGGSGLGELPRVLDAIADKGGFSSVVLSDDVGLPLAANASALDVETHAGMASFLMTLADRAERNGTPRPQAFVVLDESNQHVLHRMFAVDASRFTLTAVSRGVYVAPGALDAALAKLEKVLAKKAA